MEALNSVISYPDQRNKSESFLSGCVYQHWPHAPSHTFFVAQGAVRDDYRIKKTSSADSVYFAENQLDPVMDEKL